MSNFKNLFFTTVTLIFFLIFFELISRCFVSIIGQNLVIFQYGFNKKIDLQIREIKKFKFEIIDNNLIDHSNLDLLEEKKKEIKKKIWVFGGSTSDISCKNTNNTSWPKELNSNSTEVINYAKNGTNSDYAINTLISLYNQKKRSDIILWANYVNETDVIFFGYKRNEHLNKDDQIINNFNQIKYFFKSLSLTIKKYSIFYFLIDEIFERILNKTFPKNVVNKLDDSYSINDLKIAAHNYYINTSDAIKISKYNKTKFYIVTLFSKYDLNNSEQFGSKRPNKQKEENKKKIIFFEVIKKILDENKEVRWINLKDHKLKNSDNFSNMFCDEVHFNNSGNITVSTIINNYINND